MWRHSTERQVLLVCAVAVFAGCAGGPRERDTRDGQAPPADAVAQFEHAVDALDAGELEVATRDFEAIGRSYPEYATPLVNLGITHARAGRLEDAEQAFREAVQRAPDLVVAWSELGIVLRRQGRLAEAREAYQHALDIDANYANAHLNLAVLCDLYLNEPQEAAGAYERYLELADAPDPRVSAWLAEIRTRLGRDERTARIDP